MRVRKIPLKDCSVIHIYHSRYLSVIARHGPVCASPELHSPPPKVHSSPPSITARPHLRRCICFVSASGLRRAHTDGGAPLQRLLARGSGGALRGRARPRREAHLPAIRSCVVAVKVRAVGAGSRGSEHPREDCSLTAELTLPPTGGGRAHG